LTIGRESPAIIMARRNGRNGHNSPKDQLIKTYILSCVIAATVFTGLPLQAREEMVRRDFPRGYSIGRIYRYGAADDSMTGKTNFIGEARGAVAVPKSDQTYLIPDDGLFEHPERLDTIDPNAFDGFSSGAKGIIIPIDRLLPHVGRLTGLRRLRLTACDITDKQLAAIAPLKNLQVLNLAANDLDGSCLQYFQGMKNLTVLDLTFTGIRPAMIAEFAKFPSLENLKLGRCGVTDKTMVELGRVTRLKILYLDGCNISAKGLLCLKALKDLQILSLRGCPLTPQDVMQLKLPKLSLIMLPGGGYPPATMSALRKAFPGCKFWFGKREPNETMRTYFSPLH